MVRFSAGNKPDMRISIHSSGAKPGRGGGTVFGLIFFAVGLLVLWLVARSFGDTVATYRWPPSECTIESAKLEEDPGASDESARFRLLATYRYVAEGRERRSEVVQPGYSGSRHYDAAYELLQAYPAGARVRCYVDPTDPDRAMLRRPALWSGLLFLFPLLFGGLGVFFLIITWRRDRVAGGTARAISKKSRGGGAGCVVLFCLVLLVAGIGLLPLLGRPVLDALLARSWREVPCTILHSSVRSHTGDDSTTYNVEVFYEYEVDGRTYRSSRYRFLGGSSSGYEAKAARVAELPAGRRTVCYVDPKNPARAVLDRSLGAWALLSLIPLTLLAVGVGATMSAVRRGFRVGAERNAGPPVPGGIVFSELEERRSWLPEPKGGARKADVPGYDRLDLEPSVGPWGKLLGITLVALFWNGIVSLFVTDVVGAWRTGRGDGCATLFLVPFVLIGVAFLLAIPYQILALFNPRPRLSLDRSRLRPGEPARLSWRFTGSAGRIRHLKITLEGREEASYRRGTTTHTDRSVFATLVLFDGDRSASIASGEVEVRIPSGSMHTFSGSHNKIIWKLSLAGEIARWPDVGEEFELVVVPEAARRG